MPVALNILGHRQIYEACSLADVGPHFDKIHQWIPDKEYIEFNERMMDCVDQGTAWKTENTFLYYSIQNKRISHGVAMYGCEHPMEFIGLLVGIFGTEDKTTAIMRFKLHPGKVLEEYKAMLTDVSIERTHRDPNHPLLVRIDDLRRKFIATMKKQV